MLARQGCTTVLRATYQDSTGAFAVTIGIAVLPSPGQARDSLHALPAHSATPGVHAVPFRHTLASFSATRPASFGYLRGRPVPDHVHGRLRGRQAQGPEAADPYDKDEMLSLASGLSDWIGSRSGPPRRRRAARAARHADHRPVHGGPRPALLVLACGRAGHPGHVLAGADTVRSAQMWVLDAVSAPAAWPVTQGQGSTVAVIDSGVNPDVSDLAGSVITGPDLTGVHTPRPTRTGASTGPGWPH